MGKLFGGLLGLVIMTVVWAVRQRAMKSNLRGFDDGTLCIACHSREMQVVGDQARCNKCFHVSDLSLLRQTQLSDDQIKAITRPRD